MNYNSDEEEFRELFREIREEDRAGAPDFKECMRSAVARSAIRRERQRRQLARLAAAAVVLILIGGSIFLLEREGVILRSRRSVSIAEWKSPTDTLLEFGGIGRAASRETRAYARWTPPRIRFTARWSVLTASLTRPPGRVGARRGLQLHGTKGSGPRNSYGL